jgi:heme-degrading monooxygenase HmoA
MGCALLVRLYSYEITPGREPEFEAYVRDRSIDRVRELDGVESAWFARRLEGDSQRFVAVTCWRDYDSMVEAVGSNLDKPIVAPTDVDFDVSGSAQHFENIDEPAVGSGTEASVLRLLRGRIAHRREEEVYTSIRNEGWPLLATLPGIVDARIGRQASPEGDVILHVTVWRDRRSLEKATGGRLHRPLMPLPEGSFSVDWINHYEIIKSTTAVEVESPRT